MPVARIRGGHRQRKRHRVAHNASEAASSARQPLSSKTALFLASKWAWGEYSPQEVQRIAALVTADILTAIESSSGFSDLDALAQLGSKGRSPERCHRELVASLANNHQLVPAEVETPINNLTGKEVCKADVPLFEPHATASGHVQGAMFAKCRRA